MFTTICPEPPSARSAAVKATCNCVELAKVVTRSLWFHCAFEVGTKPVPVTVTLRPARPAVTVFCESEEITGAGLFTGNAAAVEVPPPGVAFTTVICPVPADAKSAAASATCNCVELTNVVGRLLWFHCAIEVGTKPVPVIPTFNAALPALTLL